MCSFRSDVYTRVYEIAFVLQRPGGTDKDVKLDFIVWNQTLYALGAGCFLHTLPSTLRKEPLALISGIILKRSLQIGNNEIL